MTNVIQSVSVRVPASTSNLGPGFDCLGVALRLHNEVILTCDRGSTHPEIVEAAARLFFKSIKRRPFTFSCATVENVPRMRGLGSSATIRLGVLEGLNLLNGLPLGRSSIFALCSELEGHPDNAAPSAFGGFTVVRDRVVQRFSVHSRLKFVLLIPDFEIKTPAARKILPEKVLRLDAVKNCANACAITAAFASRDYEQLQGGFADHLHQPFRTKLIPMLPRVIAAAEEAGALGGFLSGSGSTICALTLRNEGQVAAAMLQIAGAKRAKTIVTTADNRGIQIRNR
jgi:homoserine kinase